MNGAAAGSPRAAPAGLPTPNPGDVWYYAFGSNLNPTVLTGRRRVFPRASVPAKLEGWALAFNLRGIPYVEPGMASLIKLEPSQLGTRPVPPSGPIATAAQAHQARVAAGLHGVLHLVSANEWEMIKLTEGVKFKGMGYQVTPVTCETYHGQKVEALTLVAAPASAGDPSTFLPSARYMGLIREGARIHGLDPAYQQMLDAHPVFNASSSDWNVRLGQYAVAGITMAVTLPLVPLALATLTVNTLLGKKNKPPGGGTGPGAPPTPSPTPSPSPSPAPPASSNGTSTSATIAHSVSSSALAVQQAAALKAQDTKPPPGGMAVLWVRQNMPSVVGPLFFYTLGKAVQLSHDWVLKWVLGDGYGGMRASTAQPATDALLGAAKPKIS